MAQSYRSASKKFLEVLGHYNPRTKSFGVKNEERLKHWLGKNVAMSPSVHNLLVEKKLVSGGKVKAWQPKKSPTADEGGSKPQAATVAPPAVEEPKAETAEPAVAETPQA